MKNHAQIVTAFLTTAMIFSASGCGGDNKKNGNPNNNPPVASEPVEPPINEPGDPDEIPETPVDTRSFGFIETNIDLLGDFRIKKVVADGAGNYYVAFVSDVKKTAESQPEPGFAVVKFSADGNELWRFPTEENAAGGTSNPDSAGSYLLGALADMAVDSDGQVYLYGVRKTMETGSSFDNPVPEASFTKAEWTKSITRPCPDPAPEGCQPTTADEVQEVLVYKNSIFINHLDGSGGDKDSPVMVFKAKLAAPSWWTPVAISFTEEGDLVLESSSGGVSTMDGEVQQSQIIDRHFNEPKSSTCYVTPKAHSSSGEAKLFNMAFSAPKAVVDNMVAAVPAKLTIKNDNKAGFEKEAIKQLAAQGGHGGRCWDLFASKVMDEEGDTYKIYQPAALADGEPVQSRAESLNDLLSGQDSFEAFDLSNDGVSGFSNWQANILGSQPGSIEQGFARWITLGGELVHLGLGTTNSINQTSLVIGNGRTVEGKSWETRLDSSSGRMPASLDVVETKGTIVAAWVDLHSAGETHAGERALKLAYLNKNQKGTIDQQRMSYEVPESTGHTSFSSVRLAVAANGETVIFATVGTRDRDTAPGQARMKQATLLIGMKK